jgi:hypothetical protein
MEPRQIFIVHDAVWAAMEWWAIEHRMYLQRIPDGADDDGVLFFRDVGEEDFTHVPAAHPRRGRRRRGSVLP